MEVLLKVGGLDVYGGVGMIKIQVYIAIQESDMGGGCVLSEINVEAFRELSWICRAKRGRFH